MSELKKAIDQISKDRGIDRDLLIDTLEEAVRSAVARKYGETMDIEVAFNEELGEIEVFEFKVVVSEVHDPISEISLEDATAHDPNAQLDDEMGFPLKIEDLGRIAAQSAKQVIIQRMRDAEQEIIYEEYKDRVSEIASGIIQRRDRTGWIINLGRTEALLPKDEQIPRERYKRGDRVQAYIIDVLKESRGPQVVVSRSHPEYMIELFKREVPEVADGTVKIMGVSRDPGLRAKVAVMSRDRDVDPVGACVGIRGSRIQNVVQELKGERIDIVVWSPDIAMYAQHALSPALITRITVDDDEESLEVVCPDDQLTLAIGRKGQNVKLAAKLLGWKIDIFTESRYGELNAARKGMDQIASVAEVPMENFFNAGFESIESIVLADDEALLAIKDMTERKIADIRVAINMLAPDLLQSAEEDTVKDQESDTVDTTEEVAEEAEVVETTEEAPVEEETPAEGEESK
ncbi:MULTISPECIES: transcription termination factor NusA [unclassified Pseudodesulfovibrio]|uniref:transcription termination factor NusA n=1 Tax=unclassified Pseudodesulfovibrio TaxID=2661612 RepID=UPI0019D47DB5|nr:MULTISPECIES: transcription termination factor NusA [unclassified Pseudodesulfovibrio]MCJ2163176.1 transcription termination factor NusA [Pseudodesulfovibrio sp. S3-i]